MIPTTEKMRASRRTRRGTKLVIAAVLAASAATAGRAWADTAPEATPSPEPIVAPSSETMEAPPAEPIVAPSPPAAPAMLTPAFQPAALPAPNAAAPIVAGDTVDYTMKDAESARFSGGRLFVEILGGAAGGSAAAYGTYRGICGKDVCLGGALAGLGANMVATPLVVYGLGRAMGGRGKLSTTFYGAMLGFGAGAPLMSQGNLGLAVGVIMMPIMAPLFFEMNSQAQSEEMKGHLASHTVVPFAAPVAYGKGSTLGFVGTF